jgi:hypothetical protein
MARVSTTARKISPVVKPNFTIMTDTRIKNNEEAITPDKIPKHPITEMIIVSTNIINAQIINIILSSSGVV